MSELVYRSMTLPDIEQVYEIECSCFSQPWSVESLIGEVSAMMLQVMLLQRTTGKLSVMPACGRCLMRHT